MGFSVAALQRAVGGVRGAAPKIHRDAATQGGVLRGADKGPVPTDPDAALVILF